MDGTTDEIRQLRKELQRVQDLLSRSYTKEELLRMQNDKLREIQEADTSIKMAELDLRRKQAEASDSSVYSQLDGVVKAVRTPTDAAAITRRWWRSLPAAAITSPGTVSELRLDTVKVGQTVNISSRMTGAACTGEVVEISTYPLTAIPMGVMVTPMYPITPSRCSSARISSCRRGRASASAIRRYPTATAAACIWRICTSARKRQELRHGRGENGKLEQRWVQTGKVVWDSYTQIRGGLTQEDYVAFPYGRDVVSGAKTEEATVDALHSW